MATVATLVDTAESTTTHLPHDMAKNVTQRHVKPAVKSSQPPSKAVSARKYNHVHAVHKRTNVSPLDYEATVVPSWFGFKNLMALLLIVSNLRLMIENFRKYGNLVCISCHQFQREDLLYGSILYFSVPCHLLIAYLIELLASQHAKATVARLSRQTNGTRHTSQQSSHESFQVMWYFIAVAHALNATLNLVISSIVVYNHIYHPGIGAVVVLHATITWLKVCSYAFTNRDLRHSMLHPDTSNELPELYATCPYPQNITLSNLCYFWWAPTLVYQPVYPRTERVRRTFVAKRIVEVVGLSIMIWIATMQYASPLLRNSLDNMEKLDLISILERTLKLSTISLFCWLCGFYALFHSFLNGLAEILRFADRDFYSDWWNVSDLRTYWTSWNKPVTNFMRRHIYAPLVGRGMSPVTAQILVFIFSGLLHELLIGVPTHNLTGVAFGAMVGQIPLIHLTDQLRNTKSHGARIFGNMVFWLTFVIFGQPIAAMVYFFAWQRQYGELSKKA